MWPYRPLAWSPLNLSENPACRFLFWPGATRATSAHLLAGAAKGVSSTLRICPIWAMAIINLKQPRPRRASALPSANFSTFVGAKFFPPVKTRKLSRSDLNSEFPGIQAAILSAR